MTFPRFTADKIIMGFVNAGLYVQYYNQIKKFRRIVGHFPNVSAPKRYNELMLWRKIFDHNPVFSTFCDKLATKDYIQSILPQASIPKTLWVGTDVEEIPQELIRGIFLLKANHGCDFNFFGNGERLDIDQLKSLTSRWLKTTYGEGGIEWAYRDARKFLFLEELIEPPATGHLIDLSIRASNGRPFLASVIINNKTPKSKIGYFAIDGTRKPEYETFVDPGRHLPPEIDLPSSFPLAIEYTRKLSESIDYARYDFLCACDKIYAGEITVYPAAGLTLAEPLGFDGMQAQVLGNWDMRPNWFLNQHHVGWKKVYARAARRHFGLKPF